MAGGGKWHIVFIHIGTKTRELTTILLESQMSVLGNISMSGESLAHCMAKINNICTCNRWFDSN